MEVEPGTTEGVYAWICAARAMRRFHPSLDNHGTLCCEKARSRARGKIKSKAWTLTRVVHKGAAHTVVNQEELELPDEPRHLQEPSGEVVGSALSDAEQFRQWAEMFRPTAGFKQLSTRHHRGVGLDVLRLKQVVTERRQVEFDTGAGRADPRDSEDPTLDGVAEGTEKGEIDPREAAAACALLRTPDRYLMTLRFAHPDWGWKRIVDELKKLGHTTTHTGAAINPGWARQVQSRLISGEHAVYDDHPDLDRTLFERIRHHKKESKSATHDEPEDPKKAARAKRAEKTANVERAREALAAANAQLDALRERDWLTCFAVVVKFREISSERWMPPDQAVEHLAEKHDTAVTAADLHRRRTAWLETLTDVELASVRVAAIKRDLPCCEKTQ